PPTVAHFTIPQLIAWLDKKTRTNRRAQPCFGNLHVFPVFLDCLRLPSVVLGVYCLPFQFGHIQAAFQSASLTIGNRQNSASARELVHERPREYTCYLHA